MFTKENGRSEKSSSTVIKTGRSPIWKSQRRRISKQKQQAVEKDFFKLLANVKEKEKIKRNLASSSQHIIANGEPGGGLPRNAAGNTTEGAEKHFTLWYGSRQQYPYTPSVRFTVHRG